jgi:hypothetical protein
MAYGPVLPALFKQAASYVARILGGAKAGHCRSSGQAGSSCAKALGLELPLFLQQRADEVIE